MIAYISGKVLDISQTHVLILASSGVGYEVAINELTYSKLATQEYVDLYIHHHISEATQALYWFVESEEKKVFLELIKISGIGGKVALTILSLGMNYIIEAVQNEDKAAVEQIKGIWKKMAEKIILELKDKDFIKTTLASQKSSTVQTQLPPSLFENLKSTLANMWYRPRDIERVLWYVPENIDTPETILAYVIKELS